MIPSVDVQVDDVVVQVDGVVVPVDDGTSVANTLNRAALGAAPFFSGFFSSNVRRMRLKY